ncbi:MAG TPA: phosphotransferase [Woeseiaceae bacterium]|nr:phosphotransferase [Woeseiaceae bacterium]
MDARAEELRTWLETEAGLTDFEIVPASEDASFRRYFRVHTADGTRIAMDAPPEREDSRPFVEIAGWLELIGVNAPRILAANLRRGLLLLTDLGSLPYLTALEREPGSADRLYGDALAALRRIQERGRQWQRRLPPYDEKLLRFELSLFRDWLCGRHLGLELTGDRERSWAACCDLLVANALDQPRVFVHRDYHSRNLMVTETANPGILDFQDAVEGPLTYDLVSLLKDCYIRWPAERVRDWALAHFAALDRELLGGLGQQELLARFELMGVQRHLKAAGIFARLCHRDGKAGYLRDVPRTLSYVLEVAPRYPALEFLAHLVEHEVLPRMARG